AADDVLFDLLVTADGVVPKILERISAARRAVRLEAGDDQEILFRSASGQGLSDVRVELRDRWTVATSDASGSARLAVPADRPLEVSYEAGDRRRPGERLSRDPEGGAAFVLMPPPAAVGGRIVDARTRGVVAGAWVWPIGAPARGARSDDQGSYLVSGLHPSESWFIAAAEGYRPTIVQAYPAWGAPAEAPAVALQPATTIRGRAVSADGRPIPKARIEVEALSAPRGSRMQAPVNASLLTAADGSFSVSALLPQTRYRVTAGKEGWAPSSVVLPAAAPGLRDLEPLVLTRGASLLGQVVDGAGGGVIGTRLLLVPERGYGPAELAIHGTSAEDGLFWLREVPPGSYRLSAEHPDFAVAVVPGIAVEAGVAELELPTVELRRGARLEGIVLDAESSPLAGAEVTRLEPGAPESHSRPGATPPAVLSSADGGFRIEQLQPGVEISLEVTLEGYAPTTLHGLRIPTAELVEVVLEAEASISGRVTTVDGHVLEKAAVSLSSAGSNPGQAIAEALSDADGRFRLPGLPAGSFELLVSAVGFQQHREKVEDLRAGESRSDLDVELDAGGVVRGVGTTSPVSGSDPPGTSITAGCGPAALESPPRTDSSPFA
ncbi:MAG: carboxypeptidase-like regulatory domain-containing protein, partial [Acidobacteriota bacterium]